MNYLIQGETLTAIADRIRSYTSVVGNSTHIIDDEFLSNVHHLVQGAVLVLYYENVDSIDFILGNCDYPDEYDGGANGCDYLQNAEGNTVPVIYLGLNDTEPYFYVGVEIINGMDCDKWRKIELTDGDGGEATDEYNYTWTSERKKYIYTNRIVICSNEVNESISPTDMPSKIDEVYDAGAANGGITLPTLDNEGTAEDLVYGKQLIDSEGNIVNGTAATYDEAYENGYGYGYGYGYIKGENTQLIYHAPIILQGKIKPTVVDNFHSAYGLTEQMVMYNEESFDEGIVGENIDRDIIYYSWYNDIDYEVMISGSSLTLGVTNNSNFYVDVFLDVAIFIGSTGTAPRNVVVSIGPHSSGSYGETFSSTIREGYVESVLGFRFYMYKGA